MAADMQNMVAQMKAGVLPATEHLEDPDLVALANRLFTEARIKDVLFVLNKVQDGETESYLREKLAEKGIEPIGTVYEDRSISMAWLKGTSLEGTESKKAAARIVEELEAAEEAHTPAKGVTQNE
jgi:CO dehydrogenase nickel-insertion accessory protein CooC1